MTSPAEPALLDLAGDGRDQLVVPLSLAIVGNTTYAIYRATDAAPDFAYTGTVVGFGLDRTADGLIATTAKSGPADRYTDFWQFDDARLRLVAGIVRTYAADGSSVCRADTEGAHGDSGLSDQDVERRFCDVTVVAAQPVR
ncbi:hypothetical protein [Nocardia aurantia]|nr:hypothetical protein [Nocardia aurantia]